MGKFVQGGQVLAQRPPVFHTLLTYFKYIVLPMFAEITNYNLKS